MTLLFKGLVNEGIGVVPIDLGWTDGRIVLHCGAEDDSTLLMVVIMMMAPRGIDVPQRKGGRQQQTIPLGGDPPQFMLGWELTMLPAGMASSCSDFCQLMY